MKEFRLNFPYTKEQIEGAVSGDIIYITGPLLVMRDMAHKRFKELYETNKQPIFNVENQIIYYMGPCPKQEGQVIGSCGPTTSKRMDPYVDLMLSLGVFSIVGKGNRAEYANNAFIKHGKYYLVAIGGAGAFYSECVKSTKNIAFDDLLAEATIKIEVENFPVFVALDPNGDTIYER